MALGDGIRKNIAHVDPTERAMLLDAILKMHQHYYPGDRGDTPPGGVSWWFKQDEIHQATHVHGGPEFLPWHRELTNRLEELLRQINPQLSLHYWDFKDDPRNIPNGNIGGGNAGPVNLFDSNFMGSPGVHNAPNPETNPACAAGDPWLSAGFYDPAAGTPPMPPHPANRDDTQNPVDPPNNIARSLGPLAVNAPPAPFLTALQENAILGLQTFGPGVPTNTTPNEMTFNPNSFFRTAWELVHDNAHVYFGNVSPHIAFRDPWVFLLHSNVDRLFAMWQTDPNHPERLDANMLYGSESNLDVTVDFFGLISHQNLTHNVEPFSTGHGQFSDIRPWFAPENQGVPHDYHDLSIVAPPCYDTNQRTFRIDEVENPLNAGTNRYQVIFNDVPEEETAQRAAVIRVYTCADTTFRVKPGTEPAAPFGIALGVVVATAGAHPHLYQDVRIWFQYTAGALGTAPHLDGPLNTTIRCDETAQEFQFELRANSIHRPTVAVQMVLDQSGSMADPAGTSGLTRLEVLKDAANLFATVIQNNNGLGIIRFDDVAYPPNDPTYGGMSITRIQSDANRNTAHTAIDAHGAHGNTSIGGGLIMGHNQIIPPALPAGSYDNTAILLLTDGLENRPPTIDDAIGMGAVDTTTFAIGLGNEFQVNTGKLNQIAGSTGGNLLLSGILTPNTDDFFRVKKFFLQILAAVTNTSIVRDPVGFINVGTKIKVPFPLSEADINCRVILLTDFAVVKLSVETPDGQVIDEANAAGFGVKFKTNGNTKTSSFNLPVAFQANKIQAGTWHAILDVDAALFKRTLTVLREKNRFGAVTLQGKGARYSVSMHSFSNLRMTAAVIQNAYEPGSTVTLRANLKEYNLPVEKRATVRANLEYPDHTHGVLSLAEIQPGVFETAMVASIPGIYRFTVLAHGVTYKGVPFAREQLLTAAVFHEIKYPSGQPPFDTGKDDWCRLLACLLSEKNLSREFQERLKKEGINLAGIRNCVKEYCHPAGQPGDRQ